MKIISKSFLLSSVVSLVLPQTSFASLSSAYASLVDTSQNQAFESKPAQSLKLAAVHFITNDGGVRFGGNNPGNQEFLPGDLCKNSGYRYEGCPAGYVPGEACPHDSSFVKECINPDIWCRDNDYNVTYCTLPKYLSNQCPYSDTLYKSCEEDNARACQEAGYVAECEPGKVKDKACPYDESYGTCICNPCPGFDYTAAEASAQGYVPGEVCNSCGTTKYKRSEAPCDGFKTCDCGGATGAQTCWSGTTKKFDTCKECCDTSVYKYDTANCTGDFYLTGNSCGGKYDTCNKRCVPSYKYGEFNKDTSKCAAAIKTLQETKLLDLKEDLYCGPEQGFFVRSCQKPLSKHKIKGNGHTITFDKYGTGYTDFALSGCAGEKLTYEEEANADYVLEIENLKIVHDTSNWNHCGNSQNSVINSLWTKLTNIEIISDIPAFGGGNTKRKTRDLYGNNRVTITKAPLEYYNTDSILAADFKLYGNLDLKMSTENAAYRYYSQIDVMPGAKLNYKGGGGYLGISKGGKVNSCAAESRLSLFPYSSNLKEDVQADKYIFYGPNENDPVTVVPELCKSDIFSGDFWK